VASAAEFAGRGDAGAGGPTSTGATQAPENVRLKPLSPPRLRAISKAPVEGGPPSLATPPSANSLAFANGRALVDVGPPSLATPPSANSLAFANGRAPADVGPPSLATPLPGNSLAFANGRALVAALLIAPHFGCAGEALVQGGVVAPVAATRPAAEMPARRPALALETAVGLGPGNNHGGWGLELRARSKFGGDVTNLSTNIGLFAVAGSEEAQSWFLLGSAGVSALGAVYAGDQISFDVGSPYAQLGLGHRVGPGGSLVGSIAGDWSFRRPDTPRIPYVGLLIGYGDVAYSVHSFH